MADKRKSVFFLYKKWAGQPDDVAQPANSVVYETREAAEQAAQEISKFFSGREFFIVERFAR